MGESPPVTPKDFTEKLWKLNEVGNQEEAYITTCLTIKNRKCFDGTPITFDLLIEKYTNYLRHCRNSSTLPKFIMQIENFMLKGGYNTAYKTSNPALKKRFGL